MKDYFKNNENILKAYNKREQFKNNIISVTGTNGKTTTTNIIYTILKKCVTINKTHENSNSLNGIPWCINSYFNLESEYWLIEIGINTKNEMDKLLELVKPNIRILSNIGIAHTSNFRNDEEYINEKLKFIKNNLDDNTILILNNYDKFIKNYNIDNKNIRILSCGDSDSDQVKLIKHNINDDNVSSYAEILTDKGIIKVNYNSICKHTAINMCLAITYATYINIPLNIIEDSLNNFNLYDNRGNILIKKKFILYNFSYNCNPSSITENLKDFKKIKSNNKLIILGDMHELNNNKEYSEKIIKLCNKITLNIASESIIYINILKKYKHNNQLISNNLNNLKKNIKDFIDKQTEKAYIFIQGSFKSKLIEISDYLNNNFK